MHCESSGKNFWHYAGREKYQLKGCTGRGAFAQVYLAEVLVKNGGDGQRIVLKVRLLPSIIDMYEEECLLLVTVIGHLSLDGLVGQDLIVGWDILQLKSTNIQ